MVVDGLTMASNGLQLLAKAVSWREAPERHCVSGSASEVHALSRGYRIYIYIYICIYESK